LVHSGAISMRRRSWGIQILFISAEQMDDGSDV
jgi:hypothetical protein